MNTFKLFFATIIPMFVLDGLWLMLIAKPFYAKHLGFLMTDKPVWAAAVIFYVLYAIGVGFFVLAPVLLGTLSWWQVALRAAWFGLIAYGTYDLTNHATIANWPMIVTVVDMAWGAFVTAAAATVAYVIIK